jgi:L-asparaginase
MRTLYVVTTGGTIEKVHPEQTGAVANVDSKIDRYLRLLRLPNSQVEIVSLMNIDSLDMKDSHCVVIFGAVTSLLKKKPPILITHGTDTMVQTGLYLQRQLHNFVS